MKFKSWKDQYLFVKEYATCSCFNCRYGGEIKESDKDSDYVRTLCTRTLAMVDFQFQFPLCAEWENNDGKTLSDHEGELLFSIDGIEEIDNDLHEWTFEEIMEKIHSYEEVKE